MYQRTLSMLSLCVLLLLGREQTWADAGDTLYVQGNNVNVRAAPSPQAPSLGQLHYGYVVIEIGRQGEWVQVTLTQRGTRTGWVHASLLAIVPHRDTRRGP